MITHQYITSFFAFFFLITELLPVKIDYDGVYNVVAICQIIIFTSEGLCLWNSDDKNKQLNAFQICDSVFKVHSLKQCF